MKNKDRKLSARAVVSESVPEEPLDRHGLCDPQAGGRESGMEAKLEANLEAKPSFRHDRGAGLLKCQQAGTPFQANRKQKNPDALQRLGFSPAA